MKMKSVDIGWTSNTTFTSAAAMTIPNSCAEMNAGEVIVILCFGTASLCTFGRIKGAANGHFIAPVRKINRQQAFLPPADRPGLHNYHLHHQGNP